MPHRRRVLAAAVLAAAAACTPPADRPRPAVPALLTTADLRLPLDDYQPTPAENSRLARAHRILLRDCLRGFGLHLDQPEPAGIGPRTPNERRYGLSDPAQIGRGYWSAERTAPAARSVPARAGQDAAVGDALAGRGARVVHGRVVPAGGCAGQARRRRPAGGPPGADRELAQKLASAVYFAAARDAAVVAVTRDWSTCMRAAGFRYADPLGPPADPRFRAPLGALEVATARADVSCKKRTNLVGVWWSSEADRQRAVLAGNRAALDLTRRAVGAELAVADEVIRRERTAPGR